MKKSKYLIGFVLITSLGFSSLINTMDQISNQNPALGGNPAANAFKKMARFETGFTLMNNFAQSTSFLKRNTGHMPLAPSIITEGSDLQPNQLSNQFLKYTFQLNKIDWIGLSYSRDTQTLRSINGKVTATPTQKFKSFLGRTRETYKVNFSREYQGFYLSGEIVSDRIIFTNSFVPNQALKDFGSRSGDLGEASDRFTIFRVGGIRKLDKNKIFTFCHTLPTYANFSKKGKNIWLSLNDIDDQHNEQYGAKTSVGLIHKLNDKVEVAGTVKATWDQKYKAQYSRSSNETYGDVSVYKRGFNTYDCAVEYKYSKDVTFQGYYGWANGANQVNSDHAKVGQDSEYITRMGFSAIKHLELDKDLLFGVARKNVWNPKDDNTVTDETTAYVNYSQKL